MRCIGCGTNERFGAACLGQKDNTYCGIPDAAAGNTRFIEISNCGYTIITDTVDLIDHFLDTLLENVKRFIFVDHASLFHLKRRGRVSMVSCIDWPKQSLLFLVGSLCPG